MFKTQPDQLTRWLDDERSFDVKLAPSTEAVMPSCQCHVEFTVKPDLVYEHTIIYCPTHARAPAMVALLAETYRAHTEKTGCGCSRFCEPYLVLLKEVDNG